MTPRALDDEIDHCLPFFVRLVVEQALAEGMELDAAATIVANYYRRKMPRERAMSEDRLRFFGDALDGLVAAFAPIAPRVPLARLVDIAGQTGADALAATLSRFILQARTAARNPA